jgi:hypothetical protein
MVSTEQMQKENVGNYADTSYYGHGFVYSILDPPTPLLLGLGGVFLRKISAKNWAEIGVEWAAPTHIFRIL